MGVDDKDSFYPLPSRSPLNICHSLGMCLSVCLCLSVSLSLSLSYSLCLARALSFALSISLCVHGWAVCKRDFKGQTATAEQVPRTRQQWGAARHRRPRVRLRPPLLPAPAPCNETGQDGQDVDGMMPTQVPRQHKTPSVKHMACNAHAISS